MKDYREIAGSFEDALSGLDIPIAFENAIKIMKNHPDFCNKISHWDETMWLIIEEFLNNGGQTQEDFFFRACALLES